jgi:hypothetical protein
MTPHFILLLFIIINRFSFVELKLPRVLSTNMTCVTIPVATLSSRSDDKFSQLKTFASPQFMSNYSTSCGKFDM